VDGVIVITEILAIGAPLASGMVALYAVVVSRSVREASTRKTASEATAVEDQVWIDRVNALSSDFKRLQELSDARFDRLVRIETAITEHLQWDHLVVRTCREGICIGGERYSLDIPDPPSLQYIKQEVAAAKQTEQETRQVVQRNGTT
jgi:hypothetical protein